VLLGTIVRDTVQIVSSISNSGWNVDVLGDIAIYDPGGGRRHLHDKVGYPGDPRPAVRDFATKYEKLFGHPPDFAAEVGYSASRTTKTFLADRP